MVNLCRSDWEPGQGIDDFFYLLKYSVERANAPLRMACLILIGQLHPNVQNSMKEWLSTKDEIGKPEAREFIKRVRLVLVEKGLPLDHGNRDFKRAGEIKTKEVSQSNSLVGGNQIQTNVKGGDGQMDEYTDTGRRYRYTDPEVKVVHHSTRSSKERFQPRERYPSNAGISRKGSCFTCGSLVHLSKTFQRKYCQRCGKEGRDRCDCYARVYITSQPLYERGGWANEAGVVILDNMANRATLDMQDSGAQPSVIDTSTLQSLGVG